MCVWAWVQFKRKMYGSASKAPMYGLFQPQAPKALVKSIGHFYIFPWSPSLPTTENLAPNLDKGVCLKV